jgi:hypothetical protein
MSQNALSLLGCHVMCVSTSASAAATAAAAAAAALVVVGVIGVTLFPLAPHSVRWAGLCTGWCWMLLH